MTDQDAASSGRWRPSFDSKKVLAVLLALALAVLAVFAIGYLRLIHYQPQVAQHVPAGAAAVVRFDIKQVVLFEPVRRHVFPALEGAGGDAAPRRARFEQLADVNLAMDLREVAVAWYDTGDWLVLIGGLFPQRGVVEALAQVLSEQGRYRCQLSEARLHCDQVFLQQAADGVVVVASNSSRLERALQPGQPHPWLSDDPVSAGWSAQWAERVLNWRGWQGLQGARAELELTRDELELRLEAVPQGSVDSRERAERWLASARHAAQHSDVSAAGERAVMARARVVQHTGRPVVESHWTRDELDRAAMNFGSWLQAQLARD